MKMSNSEFVSVIIPNYNHSQFLDERIRSVLNQSYQDFELIILDDCSSDNGASRRIIEQYRNNPHVSKIIYNDINSGSAFKQWQRGYDVAKGELIWIAESDDCCDEKFLEKLLCGFRHPNTVFAFCKSCQYDVHGNKSKYIHQSIFKESFLLSGRAFICEYLFKKNLVANASSVIFRKQAAMSVSKEYINMKAEGDWLFWIELAEVGDVYFVNEELNFFRLYNSNTTFCLWEDGTTCIEHKKVLDKLLNYSEMSIFRKIIVKANYITSIQSVSNFKSKRIKKLVLRKWDPYYMYRLFNMSCRLFSLVRIAKRVLRQ